MNHHHFIKLMWRGAAALIAMVAAGCAQKVNYPVEPSPAPESAPAAPVNATIESSAEGAVETAGETSVDEAVISSYAVNVRMHGLFAEVVQEMTVEGPDKWRPTWDKFLGTLELPIPENAIIHGFAVEVDNDSFQNQMVDAVVIDLDDTSVWQNLCEPRTCFCDHVSFGIKPANTGVRSQNAIRIPCPPIKRYQSRKMRISYVLPLSVDAGGNGKLSVPLYRKNIKKHEIHVSVDMPGMSQPSANGLGERSFVQSGEQWVLDKAEENDNFGDQLDITMNQLPDVLSFVERMPDDPDDMFFAVSLKPRQPVAMPNRDLSRLRILWDASASRTPEAIEKALDVIRLLPDGGATYVLQVFRNTPDEPRVFNNKNDLVAYLQSLEYDGAADYAGLQAFADQHKTNDDSPLLFFSDGLNMLSDEVPEFGPGSAAIVSGRYYDADKLKQICGGHVYDLNKQSSESVIEALRHPERRIASIRSNAISQVQGIGKPADDRIVVTGRWNGKPDTVEITLSDGSVYSAKLQKDKLTSGRNIASAWADARVEQLAPFAQKNRSELVEIGRKYSVVSPVTQMVVPDDPSIYSAYDIEPPKEFTDIHQAWEKSHEYLMARKNSETAKQVSRKNEALERLKELWKKFVKWQNKPIPPHLTKIYSCDVCNDCNTPSQESSKCKCKQPASCEEITISDYGVHFTESFEPPKGFVCDKSHHCFQGNWMVFYPDVSATCAGYYGPCTSGGSWTYLPVTIALTYHRSYESMDRASSYTVPNTSIDPVLEPLKTSRDKGSDAKTLYAEYLRLRETGAHRDTFYINVAAMFLTMPDDVYSVRILSNLLGYHSIVDVSSDDIRIMLHGIIQRLRMDGRLDDAVRAAQISNTKYSEWLSENRFKHDLAVALEMRARKENRREDAFLALDYYKQSAFSFNWDGRDSFDDPSIRPVIEYNNLLSWIKQQKWKDQTSALAPLDKALNNTKDADLRIVVDFPWDGEDLVIIEPTSEKLSKRLKYTGYGERKTEDIDHYLGEHVYSAHGGIVVNNEYIIQKAPSGKYTIGLYYTRYQDYDLNNGGLPIYIDIFRNWGRPNQTHEIRRFVFDTHPEPNEDIVEIGSLEI